MNTKIITIIAALLSLTAGQAADRLHVEDVTLKPSEEKAFKLSLSLDKEKYAGVQFDIQLPTGFSLGMNGNNVYYAFSEKQAADLSCQMSNTGERTYRFMVYSNSLELLKNGELMTLRLKAEKGLTLKDYTLQLNDVRFSDINGVVTKLSGSSTSTVKVTDFFNLIYMVDGKEYKTVEYEYGASITPEVNPTKEGYTFSGWSEIPQTMPAKDVIVTGSFSVNKYKLIYQVDGIEYKTCEIEYGASITPEADPKKDGYTFSGWSEIPETMPAKDVIVTGNFIKKEKKGDANGDDTVNAADIVEVVNYIMGHPSSKYKEDTADANGDGVVNAADIVAIVYIIMGN